MSLKGIPKVVVLRKRGVINRHLKPIFTRFNNVSLFGQVFFGVTFYLGKRHQFGKMRKKYGEITQRAVKSNKYSLYYENITCIFLLVTTLFRIFIALSVTIFTKFGILSITQICHTIGCNHLPIKLKSSK